MTDLVPPGHQPALFVFPSEREQYRVVDRAGVVRLATGALGVALVVAARLAADDGEAWITGQDGAAARIGGDGTVITGTPRPWIDNISHAHHGGIRK